MPCSLSVSLSVQRSPLSDSRLVTYLCSPISSLFNLSSFLRCSMGHFHYGMLCAFPPSVCTCVNYNADQEGGLWKISREVRASSRPGQSKQLLWAVGYGDRRAACGPAVTTCGLFLWHSLCKAGWLHVLPPPHHGWGRVGMQGSWWWWARTTPIEAASWVTTWPSSPSPLPTPSCLWKEKLFPTGLVLLPGAAVFHLADPNT